MRHATADDGSALIAIRDPHPRALIDIAAYAVESVVVSHQSICTILGLPKMTDLDALVTDLEELQAAAAVS
jgi:hypothetical protein